MIDSPRKRVLWAKRGAPAIVSTPIDGSASTLLLDVAVDEAGVLPERIVQDEANIYWSSYGSEYISRVSLPKGDVPLKAISGPGINVGVGPVISGSSLYFVTMVTSDPVGDPGCYLTPPTSCWSVLVKGPLPGSEAQGTVVFDGKAERAMIGGVATDGTSVYFTAVTSVGTPLVKVYRVPAPGAGAQEIARHDGTEAGEIVAEEGPSGRLFWIGPAALYRSEKDGSGMVMKAPVGWGANLVMDDQYLYWVDEGINIARLPKSAGALIYLRTGDFAAGLAVNCNHVFWTETKDPESATTALGVFRAAR